MEDTSASRRETLGLFGMLYTTIKTKLELGDAERALSADNKTAMEAFFRFTRSFDERVRYSRPRIGKKKAAFLAEWMGELRELERKFRVGWPRAREQPEYSRIFFEATGSRADNSERTELHVWSRKLQFATQRETVEVPFTLAGAPVASDDGRLIVCLCARAGVPAALLFYNVIQGRSRFLEVPFAMAAFDGTERLLVSSNAAEVALCYTGHVEHDGVFEAVRFVLRINGFNVRDEAVAAIDVGMLLRAKACIVESYASELVLRDEVYRTQFESTRAIFRFPSARKKQRAAVHMAEYIPHAYAPVDLEYPLLVFTAVSSTNEHTLAASQLLHGIVSGSMLLLASESVQSLSALGCLTMIPRRHTRYDGDLHRCVARCFGDFSAVCFFSTGKLVIQEMHVAQDAEGPLQLWSMAQFTVDVGNLGIKRVLERPFHSIVSTSGLHYGVMFFVCLRAASAKHAGMNEVHIMAAQTKIHSEPTVKILPLKAFLLPTTSRVHVSGKGPAIQIVDENHNVLFYWTRMPTETEEHPLVPMGKCPREEDVTSAVCALLEPCRSSGILDKIDRHGYMRGRLLVTRRTPVRDTTILDIKTFLL